jgi:hypothetical protein
MRGIKAVLMTTVDDSDEPMIAEAGGSFPPLASRIALSNRTAACRRAWKSGPFRAALNTKK